MLKRNFDEMTGAARGMIHPKVAKKFKSVFEGINTIGGDIRADRKARTSRRTWKDNTSTTMYLK
jgi:hypothetical protein